ncbi:homoprotocatechuate degradation operon regulator HpaR [Glaciimonas immobilis]|uniref:Homoprotocatechuate degradation regulator HpaR n=1 Tax=Glaciimonas immobilis TaxID=728004 RepID=A0A840RXB9_9BURK|nr:homoprotocatechuate degradation operon regulator HpaR [Glaciimonas immobilis]KAF3996570.1 homoprotocatechuate degradation operon regulator HpaR [Glaciimonas immobilis]MBB5201059.1 homoprotocatechuate degradation regulator HpaR [Glaciimonas immobilis]
MKHRIAYSNLPQLFLKARERLMSHFRPILNHFGVTEQQWRILRLLDEYGQLEPRELCEMTQILSSSMAGVLARMEEVDLICRNRIVDDRRRVLVQLAPSGDQLIREIAPLIDLQYKFIEQAFGKPVMADLLNAFEGFIAAEPEVVLHVPLSPGPVVLQTSKAGKAAKAIPLARSDASSARNRKASKQ